MLTKEQFAAMQDHSCLGNYVSHDDVVRFCNEVLQYGFASVYVNPCDVKLAKSIIGDKAGVGTVIGFPQGVNTTETKIFEGLNAIDNGATELDIVINISKLKDGDHDYCRNELTEFTKAMKARKNDVIVKVIIECYHLTHAEKIAACYIVADSGADYIKQSTGTTPNSSFNLGDIKLMNALVGDRLKIKSAGWIINLEDAIGTVEFGASRIGNSIAPQWLAEWDENHWYDPIKK
jgi:deoxyribose-phosphate aldolase